MTVQDLEAKPVPDPHWLALRGSSGLPSSYLPPAMGGPTTRPVWLRGVALVLVAMFVAATTAGVCLTYGPSAPWH